jgi:hypothetical protein
MRSRFARIVAIAACLAAPMGWAAHSHAATSGELTITGNVVNTAMSLTLSTTSFSFGEIAKTADPYDPATSTAKPFTATGGEMFGVPDGMAWFARTPIIMTVTNPVTARVGTCLESQTNVVDGSGLSRLYMAWSAPSSEFDDPVNYLSGQAMPDCATGVIGLNFGPHTDAEYAFFPAYLVRSSDTPNTFSATVEVSVAAI